MDNLTILIIVLAGVIAVTVLLVTLRPKPEEKNENLDISTAADEDLRSLVDRLSRKIEDMERQDNKLKDEISSLQLMSGIEREQAKYLTAAVNRTLTL